VSRKKKRPLLPRTLRMDRQGRLQSARKWLAMQRGRPLAAEKSPVSRPVVVTPDRARRLEGIPGRLPAILERKGQAIVSVGEQHASIRAVIFQQPWLPLGPLFAR
jgi:hypothetical protein